MELPTIPFTIKSTGQPFLDTRSIVQTWTVARWKRFGILQLKVRISSLTKFCSRFLPMKPSFAVTDAFLQGLAFDRISANLYVGTRDGKVFVCDTSASRSFTCHLLLTGRGDVDRGWNHTEPYQWVIVKSFSEFGSNLR